jgi:hypothetical protein
MKHDLKSVTKSDPFSRSDFFRKHAKNGRAAHARAIKLWRYDYDGPVREQSRKDYEAFSDSQTSQDITRYQEIQDIYGTHRTEARDRHDIEILRRFLEKNAMEWDPVRVAMFALETEDQNRDAITGYIQYVVMGGIPEDIWWEVRKRVDYTDDIDWENPAAGTYMEAPDLYGSDDPRELKARFKDG